MRVLIVIWLLVLTPLAAAGAGNLLVGQPVVAAPNGGDAACNLPRHTAGCGVTHRDQVGGAAWLGLVILLGAGLAHTVARTRMR